MSTAPAVVVARLTASTLLGRRRVLVLMALPAVLLVVAVLFRALAGARASTAVTLVGGLGLGTLVPLLCVIVGTGVIGPEIEDGSIVYLLAKPLRRPVIVVSKLAVAVVTAWVLAAVPILLAGLVLAGGSQRLAVAYAVGAVVAALAYCSVFLLLAVLTRNAVIVGLLYALIWETTVAGFVPGARSLSIRQWSLAVVEWIVGADAESLGAGSDVGLVTSVVALVVVTGAATVYAGVRLRSLRLTTTE